MAKKRLNTRLVVIVLGISAVLGAALLVAGYKYKYRDPRPYLEEAKKADAELQTMAEAVRAEVAKIADPRDAFLQRKAKSDELDKKRKEAERAYNKAYGYARGDLEMKRTAATSLAKMFESQGRYKEMLGTLMQLQQVDPKNLEVKRKLADFFYLACKQGFTEWPRVDELGKELIELAPEDPQGYLLRAHAAIVQLQRKSTEDLEKTRQMIDEMLGKAKSLSESVPDYYHLAGQYSLIQASQEEDASKQAEFRQQALGHYQEGMQKNPEKTDACYYYAVGYLIPETQRLYMQYKQIAEEGPAKQNAKAEYDRMYEETQGRLKEFMGRFTGDTRYYGTLASLMRFRIESIQDLDPYIAIYREALAREPQKGEWYLMLADALRLRAGGAEQPGALLGESYDLLRSLLYMPSMNWSEGTDQVMVRSQRLAGILTYIDVVAALSGLPERASQREAMLAEAEEFVNELRDVMGEKHPHYLCARGMYLFAKKDYEACLKYLSQANEQWTGGLFLKKKMYYALLESGRELMGWRYGVESLQEGFQSSIVTLLPELRPTPLHMRDVIRTTQKMKGGQPMEIVLALINQYDRYYPQGTVYSDEILCYKAEALFRTGRLKESREALAKSQWKDREYSILQLQMMENPDERYQALLKLVRENPEDGELLVSLLNYELNVRKEGTEHFGELREILDRAIAKAPENVAYKLWRLRLDEPNPREMTLDRQRELMLSLLNQIPDPLAKTKELGMYYLEIFQSNLAEGKREPAQKNLEQARNCFQQVLEQSGESEWRGRLFETMLFQQELKEEKDRDWSEAQSLLEQMVRSDAVGSLPHEANLKISQKKYSEAIDLLKRYLDDKPFSVNTHFRLAQVYQQVGDMDQAEDHANKAALLDNANIQVLTLYAGILHHKNLKKGLSNLDIRELQTIRSLFERILEVDGGNVIGRRYLVSYYPLVIAYLQERSELPDLQAEVRQQYHREIERLFTAATDSCRFLLNRSPQDANSWGVLANLYYQYSRLSSQESKKKEWQDKAEQVYQEGLKKNPQSVDLATAYGLYLRQTGRGDQAEAILQQLAAEAQGPEKHQATIRLSQMYVQQRDYAKAKELLETVLQEDAKHTEAMANLAELLVLMNEPNPAVEMYDRIRAIRDSDGIRSRQVEILLRAGQTERAEQMVGEMEKAYPDSLRVPLMRGMLEMNRLNYTSAAGYADQVLSKDSSNTAALQMKSQAYYYEGQYEKSIEILRQLRTLLKGNDDTVRVPLAKCYWAVGRFDEGILELQTHLSQEPADMRSRQILIQWLKERNRWEDLDAVYSKAIELYPKSVDLHVEAGRHAMDLSERHQKQGAAGPASQQSKRAMDFMKQAWNLSQETGQGKEVALAAYLDTMIRAGNYTDAIALADANLQQVPGAATVLLMNKAQAQYRLKQNAAALQTLEAALQQAGENASLQEFVLQNIFLVSDVPDVQRWAQAKLQSQPDWPLLHQVLANVYIANRQMEPAIRELQAAREKSTGDSAIQIDMLMALLYQNMGQTGQANQCYKKVLAEKPGLVKALNNLAYNLVLEGKELPLALEYSRKAYESSRNNPDIMDTYALAQLRNGQYESAEGVLRQAIQIKQQRDEAVPVEFQIHMAEALIGQQRTERAQQILLEQLKRIQADPPRDPKTEYSQTIQKMLETLSKTESK